MALNWKQLALDEPIDAVDLWIRVYWYQGTPVKAQYNSTNQEFTTNLLGIVFPAWAVARWAYPAGYTPVTNEPEVVQYINGLTTALSGDMIGYLNDLVAGLKQDLSIALLSDFFDAIWLRAAETEETALKNLVKNAFHSTAVNGPNWVQYEGYGGNGTNQYLQTGFNPFLDADALSQNSCSILIGCSTNIEEDTSDFGMRVGGSEKRFQGDTRYANKGFWSLSSNAYSQFANTDSKGHFYGTRRGATEVEIYKNGVSIYTDSDVSNSFANLECYEMASNDNGTATRYSTRTYGYTAVATGITDAQATLITNRLETYLDAIGSGIIT